MRIGGIHRDGLVFISFDGIIGAVKVIVVLKLLRGGFLDRRAFLLFLCPALIAWCDLFSASLVDYYLEHNEIVRVTGLAAGAPGIMSGGEVLIPPGETVALGLTLENPRNFTVRQELLDVPEGKDIAARQTGRTEIEVIIAGAAEGDEYRLTLAMQSPDGLRDFPAYPLPLIRCVSFETKLRDFTVDGVSAPGFDPALDAFQVDVSYSRSRPVLGATTEHPKAVVEFYAGEDGSGGLLAVGTHTLELPQDLAVGDNHFYLKISAPSASVQGYGLTVHRALASEIGMKGFFFVLDGKRYGVGAGVESGSGSMSGTAVTVTLPYGTDVTALTATADYTGASISPNPETATSYASPVDYTVTAEDGTTETYTVTVNVALNPAKAITAFAITSPVDAVGIIDETAKTITVHVPYWIDVTAMTATATHTGASISPNPETAPSYAAPVDYTVTAEDGTTKSYTVRVNEGPGITIGGITVDGLGVLTFGGVPSSVAQGVSITIAIIEGVTPDSWYVEINGPVTQTGSTTNTVTFTAPSTPGFYNVNVIATVGGVDYSGSFGMIVQ